MDWMSEPPYGTYVDINAPKMLEGEDAHAVKVLAEHGNDPSVIAAMLKISEADVKVTLGLLEAEPAAAAAAAAEPPRRPAPLVKPGSDFHGEQYMNATEAGLHRRAQRADLELQDSQYARELQAQLDAGLDSLPALQENPAAAEAVGSEAQTPTLPFTGVEAQMAALQAEVRALRAEVAQMRGVMFRAGTMMVDEARKL